MIISFLWHEIFFMAISIYQHLHFMLLVVSKMEQKIQLSQSTKQFFLFIHCSLYATHMLELSVINITLIKKELNKDPIDFPSSFSFFLPSVSLPLVNLIYVWAQSILQSTPNQFKHHQADSGIKQKNTALHDTRSAECKQTMCFMQNKENHHP